MKLKDWLTHWNMTALNIKTPFLEMEWQPVEADQNAAWELYVELLTRVTTQPLSDTDGDEKSALDSVYQLYPLTRQVMKSHGRHCQNFTKIAVLVLNQIIRPFTAKWHKVALNNAFNEGDNAKQFRQELTALSEQIHTYTRMLADMADVEDLTKL
jgi:hypothetical protein